MKILVTGAAGMLGRDLVAELGMLGTVTGVDVSDFDIRDKQQCRSNIAAIMPDWIVNSAAYTAVDRCESDVAEAFAVNAEGAANLAEAAREVNARLVQISTDYVFNGNSEQPYTELSTPAPQTQYGRSKWEGERRVQAILSGSELIVRTAWLFGVHGRNFVDTMIGLADKNPILQVVDDQTGCPTFTHDLAKAIRVLIRSQASGVFHVTNSGVATWFEFASYFLRKMFPEVQVVPVTTNEFPRPAQRPKYSILSLKKYQNTTGETLPDWRDAVDRYMTIKFPEKIKE